MCRFFVYLGAPVTLRQFLYEPENPLVRQSFKAREREEPLNGDGFGVGWYQPDIESTPGLFVSVQPAWGHSEHRPRIRVTRPAASEGHPPCLSLPARCVPLS